MDMKTPTELHFNELIFMLCVVVCKLNNIWFVLWNDIIVVVVVVVVDSKFSPGDSQIQ